MTRRGRYLMWGGMVIVVTTMATVLTPLTTQGASRFANAAFETQWQTLERGIPNFYGPLSTAYDPSAEPYVEGVYNGQSGVRVVQYFDKARLEQITPERRITSGLLTVELKSGKLQLGNDAFAQHGPAYIGIAGDPGGGGPTYADLQQLPERVMQGSGSVNLRFEPSSNTFATTTASPDPEAAFAEYIADPNGRFGQNVPRAFADFLRRIPGGSLTTMGYPIGPAFTVNVRLKGVNNTAVIVQPFQRRVLTYTPSNREATRVEFGNIGRHYFQWRSSLGTPGTGVPPLTPPVFVTNTPGASNTPGPTATNTPAPLSPDDATVTAVVIIATNAAASATAAQNLQTATAVSVAATGTFQTATAAVTQGTVSAVQATTAAVQTQTAALQTQTAGVPQTATAAATESANQTAAAGTAAAATASQNSQTATGAAIAYGTQTVVAALTAAPATATQISLDQTAIAIAIATQAAVAQTQTAVAGGMSNVQSAQQAFRPQRTPAASARA